MAAVAECVQVVYYCRPRLRSKVCVFHADRCRFRKNKETHYEGVIYVYVVGRQKSNSNDSNNTPAVGVYCGLFRIRTCTAQ